MMSLKSWDWIPSIPEPLGKIMDWISLVFLLLTAKNKLKNGTIFAVYYCRGFVTGFTISFLSYTTDNVLIKRIQYLLLKIVANDILAMYLVYPEIRKMIYSSLSVNPKLNISLNSKYAHITPKFIRMN